MAEAHILVPSRQWFPTDDAPGFTTAMSGAGAAWGTHQLTAWPDHDRGRITARRGNIVVGEVQPQFLIDGDPAVDRVHVLWTPKLANGPSLSAETSWHLTATALAHALSQLASPTP
ncbi:hypothetical protein BS329_30475 [Amycolatopsis coloradensis]|uniref:Uncharacterized protein n=1 Tax=Amycolatopsis coloradensis TaxID=76021 RepID=A0A1R0KKD4_9PSEU|nr:hypothetical protein [Amycolatopsis coloradensis]OLZ46553.1 hypothetical protein BS329_30475 [Amycolatopsis coloradensis]